jgi:hypothetical protein
MTNDSKLFPPRWKWEEQSYRPDEYGHWLKGNWQPHAENNSILKRPFGLILSADGNSAIRLDEIEDMAVPLYQGAMIHQFDYCASAYRRIEGKRGFKWVPINWAMKRPEPQFLMGRRDFTKSEKVVRGTKVAYRRIAPTTNARTFICTPISSVPCGDSIFLLESRRNSPDGFVVSSILNSFAFDWITRQRLVGSNLSYSVIEDLPLVRPELVSCLEQQTASLVWPDIVFARPWMGLKSDLPWKRLWALTAHERMRLRVVVEALVAHGFGIGKDDFGQIMKQCDYPIDAVGSNEFTRKLDTKGFWRYEKGQSPELRLGVLAQVAYDELCHLGQDDFLSQNDGEGWMLPETLRLADYGLGHDDRAKKHQPIAAALGPRFHPWQLEQSVEESWDECERHADILDKLLPRRDAEPEFETENWVAPTVDLFGDPLPTDLFGNLITKSSRR